MVYILTNVTTVFIAIAVNIVFSINIPVKFFYFRFRLNLRDADNNRHQMYSQEFYCYPGFKMAMLDKICLLNC